MKLIILTTLCVSFFIVPLYSGEGDYVNLDKVEMDINHDNYILFEDESMILCDRRSDVVYAIFLLRYGVDPDGQV